MSLTPRLVVAIFAIVIAAAAIEIAMGRLPLGPDGTFGWLETDIWSSHQSQRVLDPYSFSHIIHGFAFYGATWLLARRWPAGARLLAALVVEGGWEIFENTPFVINRYREATISLDYYGDSVINSVSDMLAMVLGFVLASRLKVSTVVAVTLALELFVGWAIRDNLTLNILMLVHPSETVKQWQSGKGD